MSATSTAKATTLTIEQINSFNNLSQASDPVESARLLALIGLQESKFQFALAVNKLNYLSSSKDTNIFGIVEARNYPVNPNLKDGIKSNVKISRIDIYTAPTSTSMWGSSLDRVFQGYQYEKSPRALVTVELQENSFSFVCQLNNLFKLFNVSINERCEFIQDGKFLGKINFFEYARDPYHYSNNSQKQEFSFELNYVFQCIQHIGVTDADNTMSLIKFVANSPTSNGKIPVIKGGIGKIYKVVEPIARQCLETDPLAVLAFYSIASESHRSEDGVKLSVIFNDFYKDVKTVEQFLKVTAPLKPSINENKHGYYNTNVFTLVKETAFYKEQRKKVLKSTGHRAFNKLMQEFDSLSIDEKQFPKTTKLIKSGKIPLTTFFRKSEAYFLVNNNWALWEDMLKRGHEAILIELANEVCKRSTYEKDIMSYFYFVLYGLPEYLKKHTGKKWTCSPKLVNSATELEPPSDDGTGIRRSRSALTPIVDNEANTVEVPYASLRIPGQQTTYCYSLNYSVLFRGFSWKGNACHLDIEEKLNGRDDYGLMFYTLTGSAQGRGYPTFLIIFERRESGTHVHFHRTHPSRSKDNEENPVHNWIRVCYNWMVGNVNKDLIRYQQGDLVFIAMTEDEAKDIVFAEKVQKYDNHGFSKPVEFAPYAKKEKSNILGYARLTEPTVLEHNEHEHVPMEPGTYSIRQCRSWEANPKGVWSLRID